MEVQLPFAMWVHQWIWPSVKARSFWNLGSYITLSGLSLPGSQQLRKIELRGKNKCC